MQGSQPRPHVLGRNDQNLCLTFSVYLLAQSKIAVIWFLTYIINVAI